MLHDSPTRLQFACNLPICGSCITGSKEYRLRLFEKRVLRLIFGPEREETIKGWRKLHNRKLHELYSSPNV
jgi:hypothetical protein